MSDKVQRRQERHQTTTRSNGAEALPHMGGYRDGSTVEDSTAPSPPTARQRRRRARARRVRLRLFRGMRDADDAVFFTLTRGRDVKLQLRGMAWKYLAIKLRQRWPNARFATIYEFEKARGAHLHLVVVNAPGLTQDWVVRHLQRFDNSADGPIEVGDWQEVWDATGLAGYLAKQLSVDRILDGWPRNFQPVTFSRHYGQPWKSQREWQKDHLPGNRLPAARPACRPGAVRG